MPVIAELLKKAAIAIARILVSDLRCLPGQGARTGEDHQGHHRQREAAARQACACLLVAAGRAPFRRRAKISARRYTL